MDWRKDYYEPYVKGNEIGIIILSVGVIAILTMSFFAVKDWFGGDNNSQDSIYLAQQSQSENVSTKKAAQKPAQQYKRQSNIKERQIVGTWQANTQNGRVLLLLKDGQYRMVILPANGSGIKYYSNGGYEMKDDIIKMRPNMKSPPPQKGGPYRILTRSPFPVAAAIYKNNLIMQAPPSGTGLYVPPNHPLLNNMMDKIAVFSALQ